MKNCGRRRETVTSTMNGMGVTHFNVSWTRMHRKFEKEMCIELKAKSKMCC
jgi:hypothetical protein